MLGNHVGKSEGQLRAARFAMRACALLLEFERCAEWLDGAVPEQTLSMDAGTLAIFCERKARRHVRPAPGMRTRMLAYNAKPGVLLSELARM